MNIFFSTEVSNLTIYFQFDSAASYTKFLIKTHTHSEYDTEFSDVLDGWKTKKYYDYFLKEELVGHSTVIALWKFSGGNCCSDEFKKELQAYFDIHSPGFFSIRYTLPKME